MKLQSDLQIALKQLHVLKLSEEEKNKKIEQQRSEITKLRKENIEYKSEINTLKFKLAEEKKKS
jgi:cell division protein FtsB